MFVDKIVLLGEYPEELDNRLDDVSSWKGGTEN